MQIIIKEKDRPFELKHENKSGKIRRALVHHKGSFYIVSENTVLKETLIFPASPTGEIESWSEVGGGKGLKLEEVLGNFENELYGYF